MCLVIVIVVIYKRVLHLCEEVGIEVDLSLGAISCIC